MTEEKNGDEVFSSEKNRFLEKLDDFHSLLVGARVKVASLSPELGDLLSLSIEKAEVFRNDAERSKLRIALVGAFSDGKTSTVAGFLRHVDPSMKIAEAESSDEIVSYKPANLPPGVPPCEFIDTPGLFGQKFSKIIEDYISQAHIILYIVNATNPLKDSHQPMVVWLMNTLKKLDNAIFVINRMDDVCDYTDPDDYETKVKTKTEFLRNNVARFCGLELNDPRVRDLHVVCVASNPENKGLANYWLKPENCGKYEISSRMSELRRKIGDVLARTLSEKLIQRSSLVAMTEEARKNCVRIGEELARLQEAVIPETKQTLETLTQDVANAKKDLRRAVRPCREELEALEKRICDVFRVATRDTFTSAVEDELGGSGAETGYKLQGKIADILSEHFSHIVSAISNKFASDVDIGCSNVSSALNAVKTGANMVGNLAKGVDKAMIFAGRDILGKIGIAIKFKPWQATKLAGFASKGVPLIGAGVSLVADIWSMVAESNAEQKLADAKKGLVDAIQKTFRGIYEILNLECSGDTQFYDALAPQVVAMENTIESINGNLKKLEDLQVDCSVLRDRLESFWEEGTPSVRQTCAPKRKGILAKLFGV